MSKIIVFASPVFLLLVALEYWWSLKRPGRVGYRLNDTLANLSLGMVSQLWGVLTKLVLVGVYAVVQSRLSLVSSPDFWSSGFGFLVALVLYDFCYYWQHRLGHTVSLMWAGHVVHHQSQTFNLGTALRQPSTTFLVAWMFYLPMALAGVPPLVFGLVAMVDLLYQFWVHTEYVGKLGWYDRWFCSPSNHRVHHAVNDGYVDKNYGGILIVWDRLFGSFKEEDDAVPCVYGTRGQLDSWDPLWANADVYATLLKTSWHAPRWADKLLVWLKPPGWQPRGMPVHLQKPPFSLGQMRQFDPPLKPGLMWFYGLNFLLLLVAVLAFLWFADQMAQGQAVLCVLAVTAGMWALGAGLQKRLSPWMVLAVQSAALATASAALEHYQIHTIFKPLVIIFVIIYVTNKCRIRQGNNLDRLVNYFLIISLIFSGIGDVLLMLPGNFFIPGLVAFLAAHLLYIAVFKTSLSPVQTTGSQWFANRTALAATLLAAVVMYTLVYPGLHDPVLKVAVGLYAIVIALMAAQAVGRAHLLQTPQARWVALGACFFMLSDSLLAINRFVSPIAQSALWILSTYYVAQLLIVHNLVAAPAGRAGAARADAG